MVMMNNIETKAPTQMTTPIGPHSGVLLMTMGMTPIEAAIDVRNTGRKRRLADSRAAAAMSLPFLCPGYNLWKLTKVGCHLQIPNICRTFAAQN